MRADACAHSRRRRGTLAVLLATAWLFTTCAALAGDAPSAEEIVADMWDRYRSVASEVEELDILIIASPPAEAVTADQARALLASGAGVVRKRALRRVLYDPGRRDRVHVVFDLPKKDAGTSFLVWRQPDEPQDEQWLYLPALRKARRIPASSAQSFVGTHFIYEDLRELAGENLGRFVYAVEQGETIEGRSTIVVAATPRAGVASAYAKRILWIDRERLFPLRIDYYAQGGKLWKRLHNSRLEEVRPGVHRAGLTEMRDLTLGETTLLSVRRRELGALLPSELFTTDYLEHPSTD